MVTNKKPSAPFTRLIGDPEENFYQLGLADSKAYSEINQHLFNIISGHWRSFDLPFREVGKMRVANQMALSPLFEKLLKSYSEGLGIQWQKALLHFTLKDLFNTESSWIPQANPCSWGSVTYMAKIESHLFQARVLSSPLAPILNKYHRNICLKLNPYPSVVGSTFQGFPFPSMTAMNSRRVSMTLNQGFGANINLKGHCGHDLGTNLIFKSNSLEDALELLESLPPITYWNVVMGFPDGKVLNAQTGPEGLKFEIHELEEDELMVFQGEVKASSFPWGLSLEQSMMAKHQNRLIKKWAQLKKKGPEGLMAQLTNTHKKQYLLQINIFEVQKVGLFPSRESLYQIQHDEPSKCLHHQQVYQKSFAIESKVKSTIDKGKIDGAKELLSAQFSFDNEEHHNTYHKLQMAQLKLQNSNELSVVQFFYLVFRFLKESDSREQMVLYSEFETLKSDLPKFWQDHCLLFMFRLKYINDFDFYLKESDFSYSKFYNIYLREVKIKKSLLLTFLKSSIRPRIDHLDIVYLHYRPTQD